MIFCWDTNIVLAEMKANQSSYIVECRIDTIKLSTHHNGTSFYTLTLDPVRRLRHNDSNDLYKDTLMSKDLKDIFIFSDEDQMNFAIENCTLNQYCITEEPMFQALGFDTSLSRLSDIFMDNGKRLSIQSVEIVRSKLKSSTVFYGSEQKKSTPIEMTLEDVRKSIVPYKETVTFPIDVSGYTVKELISKILPKPYSSGFFQYDNNGKPAVVEGTLVKSEIYNDNGIKCNLTLLLYNKYLIRNFLKGFIFCRTYKTLSQVRTKYTEGLDRSSLENILEVDNCKEIQLNLPKEALELLDRSEKVELTRDQIKMTTVNGDTTYSIDNNKILINNIKLS